MKLTNEDVLKVGELSKIDIEENVDTYRNELNIMLKSIERIEELDIDNDIMVTPSNEENRYFKEFNNYALQKEDIFKNAIDNDGVFIVVKRGIS